MSTQKFNLNSLKRSCVTSFFILSALTLNVAAETEPAQTRTHALESLDSLNADVVRTLYKDLDQDGVPDFRDQCPNSVLGVAVDEFGCELDSDKDGVYDRFDLCPETPTGAEVNLFGCEIESETVKVVVQQHIKPSAEPSQTVISNILFNSARHDVRPDQVDILKNDTASLNHLQSDELLVITGHTDASGETLKNVRLSWRRADSVKNFIVTTLGIDPERIYISGKGELNPIADNAHSAGRQENRRIEFEIMTQALLPSDASLILPAGMAPP